MTLLIVRKVGNKIMLLLLLLLRELEVKIVLVDRRSHGTAGTTPPCPKHKPWGELWATRRTHPIRLVLLSS
jgi:hypothetical protein